MLCEKIVSASDIKAQIKDLCYEDLAEKLNRTQLCQYVSSPTVFCQYTKAISQNNSSLCLDIYRYSDLRPKCFATIAANTEKGINICNTFDTTNAKECTNSITTPFPTKWPIN